MSCRLQSRITAILLLATTLPLCLQTHGSVFDPNQSEQVGRNLQKESKPKGGHKVNLEIIEQQSNAVSGETPSGWFSQDRNLDETKNSKRHKSSSASHQSNDTNMSTPRQGGTDVTELFQSDFPGFDGQAVQGKENLSSSRITEEWLQMRPLVQCSPASIILTAKGWNYIHVLVNRVGASPVSVLHLPSDCGYNVKVTLRDLVLTAPYDGCYVLQQVTAPVRFKIPQEVEILHSVQWPSLILQNGSYVLPLLWWGMPVSISCPMTPASAAATLSGFCSYLGITLKIEGSQRDTEKYSIKVNEEWVPLVSNTCAYLMDSAPEDLILFIPFTVQCAKDGGSTLNVLLEGKIYTLSCQPHLQQSMPMVYPPYQHFLHPVYPYYHHLYDHKLMPPDSDIIEYKSALKQTPKPQTVTIQDPQTGLWPQMHQPPQMPQILRLPYVPRMQQPPQMPQVLRLPYVPQPPQVPQVPRPPQVPQVPRPPQVPQVPRPPQVPQVPRPPQVQQVPRPPQVQQVPRPPQVQQVPRPPQVPQVPRPPQVPQAPRPPQVLQKPQHRFPVLANDSSKLSPVLTCKGDHLRASLPSAKISSIKVKDVKRKVWVPVSSAPAHCGYSLQRKGRGVVFSSPIPACHSYTASPSLLSLSLKFWDPEIPRHHAVRLQCPYTSRSPTMTESSATTTSLIPKPTVTSFQPARHEIRPSHPHKPLGSYSRPSKPRDSPILSQKPIVSPLYPPKLTATSLSWESQATPLASQMHQPQVLCHAKDMSVTLPPGPITGLMVQSPIGTVGSRKAVLLDEAPSYCGYLIKKNKNGGINILLPYASCHMTHQDGQYRIVLKYQTEDGHRVEAFLSCQVPMSHECSLPFEQRLACRPSSVSAAECRELGCCYCPDTRTCYYPMDECTADQHFVFSIPASLTEPPLSPSLLVAAGNNSCTPQRVVADLAIFKIPLDGCGAHKYEVGNTVIYMLEILNTLHSVTLNYGTITRDSPFRLLIECRYLPGTVASVGYLVKSPSLGPSIQAHGVFGVQLRIAKDKQYSSYYPQYHRPLRKLLGKPLYLEVRLLNPLDPSAMLLVHYCVAYPRSANSAWVLIYDGCPNPLDVTPSHEPPPTPPEGLANHVRRFTISTFQFLENRRKEAAPGEEEVEVAVEEAGEEEEIYFMCATEVCLPSEGPCVEGCIDRAVDSLAVKS